MKPIVIPCATEDAWHAERSKAIGASEAAALIGESKYLTPLQLWSRKKLGLPDTKQETEQMEAGHFMEPANAAWYAKRWGRRVVTPQEFYGCPGAFAVIVRHPTLPLQCTPDRIILPQQTQMDEPTPARAPGPLQLKNVDRWLLSEWEEGDEAAPPLAVQIPVQVEMLCTGMEWGAIGAIVGGNRRRDADVHLNRAFIGKLGALAFNFWASLQTDLAPAPVAADLEEIKRQWPDSLPGLSCEYPHPEDVLELARVKAELSRLEEQEKALLAKIAAVAGPAETLTQSGQKLATYKSSVRRDPPREARETVIRSFRIDTSILKAAKAALPAHEHRTPILPAG